MKMLKSEKASISLFVLVAMLFFTIFATTIYIANANSESTAAKATQRIQDIYGKDTSEEGMAAVYAKLTSKWNLGYVSDGLILHYDGINNTGVGHSNTTTTWKDLSGNGNDGTLFHTNPTGSWTNNGLIFDGSANNWVRSVQLNPEQITIEVVYEVSQLKGKEQEIVCNFESGGVGININTANQIQGEGYISGYRYVSSVVPTLNSIRQTTLTYDNATLKLYNQSLLAQSLNVAGSIGEAANNTVFALGGNPTGLNVDTQYMFSGKIYNVRIYNRALTDEEITKNYFIDKQRFGI